MKEQPLIFIITIVMLLFLLFATPLIELIPNAALAAMLIAVGIKLSHPKEFKHTFEIGKEQLAIFLVTIIVTLLEDLLLGILAGVILKMIIHWYNGAPLSSFFKAPTVVSFEGNTIEELQTEFEKAVEYYIDFCNRKGIKL